VQGGLSPRPLLSVPHILADESSELLLGGSCFGEGRFWGGRFFGGRVLGGRVLGGGSKGGGKGRGLIGGSRVSTVSAPLQQRETKQSQNPIHRPTKKGPHYSSPLPLPGAYYHGYVLAEMSVHQVGGGGGQSGTT
jgi:hypothetical protein